MAIGDWRLGDRIHPHFFFFFFFQVELTSEAPVSKHLHSNMAIASSVWIGPHCEAHGPTVWAMAKPISRWRWARGHCLTHGAVTFPRIESSNLLRHQYHILAVLELQAVADSPLRLSSMPRKEACKQDLLHSTLDRQPYTASAFPSFLSF
jgi:hypothetical protein